MASEQELADMERMSNDYVPDVQGPLVGSQQSTQALIAEYAQADPVYVHKTKALPLRFSHYRTVRGDGNCGWRALAFGYFETLLRLGDVPKIRAELARLKGCNETMLEASGFDVGMCEDFTDVTFEMLEAMISSLPNHDGGASLLASFNDDSISAAVTYHFRLLTSAWMKMNPHIYADFLEGVDVTTYVLQNIEPAQIELDHLGLQGLATSVINAAGIAIEVLYLDRSEGEEVNTHQLPVLDGGGNPIVRAPTIRLLYRPGHYDLLYKSKDVTEMAIGTLANPEVRLLSQPVYDQFERAFSHSENIGGYLLDMPGFGHCVPVTTFSSKPYQCPQQMSPTQRALSPPVNIHTTLAQTSLGPAARESLSPASKSASPPSSEKAVVEDKFRKSKEQFEYEIRASRMRLEQEKARFPDATTSKREDQAHYTNEAFQPQLWHPGSESEHESGKGSS